MKVDFDETFFARLEFSGCCVKPRRPRSRRGFNQRAQTCTFEGSCLQKHHQNSTRRHGIQVVSPGVFFNDETSTPFATPATTTASAAAAAEHRHATGRSARGNSLQDDKLYGKVAPQATFFPTPTLPVIHRHWNCHLLERIFGLQKEGSIKEGRIGRSSTRISVAKNACSCWKTSFKTEVCSNSSHPPQSRRGFTRQPESPNVHI